MKRIVGGLFSLLFIVIIGAGLTLAYRNLQPQKQNTRSLQPQAVAHKSIDIDFKNLDSTLLSKDGTYYLWFCDTEDDNCAYVENEFMIPMLNKLNVTKFENIHKVNFTDCPFSKQKLLDKYNVDSTLAFVKVEVKDDEIHYSDGITWTNDDSFSFDILEKWLYDHNIWQEAYSRKSG